MHKSITICKSAEEIYAFWHDFQNLPRIMDFLDTVQGNGDGRSHWKANISDGKTVEWDTIIVEDVPGQAMTWQSVDGGAFKTSGAIHLAPAPGNRGTELRLTLDFDQSDKATGKLLGEMPELLVGKVLNHFKSLIETGEIPTTKNQPAARNGGRDD